MTLTHTQVRTRHLIWTTSPHSRRQLRQQGFHILDFPQIQKKILATRSTSASRSSLKNPAESVFQLFQRHPRVAVLNVTCGTSRSVQVLYGYLVEPAFRWGCKLLIGADCNLTSELMFPPDPDWRYPWTLERLIYLSQLAHTPTDITVQIPANTWQRLCQKVSHWVGGSSAAPTKSRLDPQQNAAVQAGDGVIQVIAPAGSGKTTVLIERVKELQRRGTDASKILCMSFNRDAKVEIGERLVRAGVDGVVVRSFHGMGLAILKESGHLRATVGGLEDEAMDALITRATAMEATTSPDTPPNTSTATPSITEAQNLISGFKLATMISPQEALKQAQGLDQTARIAARVFDLYEQELAERGRLDFDDLVAKAVALLQSDAQVRHGWQQKFTRVLVDEYQDIEPSQALLVGILAAPQDSLFCVGDEDQCIYAWRRATVQRIIELDQVYPGLERHALVHNYRCGRRITEASRRLIQHNKTRFRKPLLAGAKQKGHIVTAACPNLERGADLVAHLISDADPREVAVLARTSRLLEDVEAARRRRPTIGPDVELATIHGSKGREWNRVILFAVDEGQTPHAQALNEGGIEDERRLFYVALTRAKQRLEIICTQGQESRFLAEAGLKINFTL